METGQQIASLEGHSAGSAQRHRPFRFAFPVWLFESSEEGRFAKGPLGCFGVSFFFELFGRFGILLSVFGFQGVVVVGERVDLCIVFCFRKTRSSETMSFSWQEK